MNHLSDLSKRPSLLAEVDDYTATAFLSLLDGLFDSKDQIRPAGTDVRAENIASVALEVVNMTMQAGKQTAVL